MERTIYFFANLPYSRVALASGYFLWHMAAGSATSASFLLGFLRSHFRPGSPVVLNLQPPAKVPRVRHASRVLDGIQMHPKKRHLVLYASNSNGFNPSVATKGKADDTSTSANGPPLLTILAGLVVFLIICWVVGSIVMWPVGLIVTVLPS